MKNENIKFLKLQAKHFPTINDASREIINLSSILELPKGTEHFLVTFMESMKLFLT